MTELVTTGQTDDHEAATPPDNTEERNPSAAGEPKAVSRKEKRKALKKDKRKQIRKEIASKARAEEEARLNDPEEKRRIELEEEREKERVEKERKEFEERERIFLEELQRKKEEEEEEEERKIAAESELKLKQEGTEEGSHEDDEWEYIEEGPPEIIWQGNEIIVKKNKVKVKKKNPNLSIQQEDLDRPTSNPLPPQSEAYASFKSAPMASSTELLETVAQQVPNFGTEQDKAHCPFHIKTGACRFGMRCNRVHYYPDKSTTLLIKNMYSGPGLSWEQDEGLEYTEEEVDRNYEEFYEDVHTEFLKFGEIINFKVCRNGSFHLRGNVYVQYKSLDSAIMAYNSVHGRYFAAKQVKCEFVSITRWKVAICGEYMKSRIKTCSRGSACNFLHCFTNPGGDYEWADCDKPPPRFWEKKMAALFGYSDHDTWQMDLPSPNDHHRVSTSEYRDSYHEKRHRSIDHHEENHIRKSRHRERKKDDKNYEHETKYKNNVDIDSDEKNTPRRHRESYSRHSKNESKSRSKRRRSHGSCSDDDDFYTKKRRFKTKSGSRHKPNDLGSSNDECDDELKRYKERRRSRRRGGDGEAEVEVERRQGRSRSHEGRCFLEKNEMSDRWEPDELNNMEGGDGSRHVEKRKSRDRDDKMREKRKRI